MKKFLYPLILAILGCSTTADLQNGDLIFLTSITPQSQALQVATHSPYSHVGIIFKKARQVYVLEAVQPVKLTILQEWIQRGKGGHYVVKRLKDADKILTLATLQKMKVMGDKWLGKSYDFYFEWSDNKLYCSELVWKLYQRTTGIELASLQQLKDFDLAHPLVKQKLTKRFGQKIPLEQLVISPVSLFNSDKLVTVVEN